MLSTFGTCFKVLASCSADKPKRARALRTMFSELAGRLKIASVSDRAGLEVSIYSHREIISGSESHPFRQSEFWITHGSGIGQQFVLDGRPEGPRAAPFCRNASARAVPRETNFTLIAATSSLFVV